MKKIIILFFLAVLFSFLLVFPSQSLEASRTGLLLWFDTLMPTLLPFLIVSQLILKTAAVIYVQKFFGPIVRRIFHCSEKGAFCILCGFLCGYPVGARLIAIEMKEKHLDIAEGQYLLSFCNNVSPMFCISYGILYAIGTEHILPYLLIIYGSALVFGFLTRPKNPAVTDHFTKKQTSQADNIFQLIDVCIIDSFSIMIRLCGYLILFSIISTGILLLIPDNPHTASVITSFLEITGGLSVVSTLPAGFFRSVVTISALSFGGMCCVFQTNSVICETGLSLKTYMLHKALITLLSLFFFVLWCFCSVAISSRC